MQFVTKIVFLVLTLVGQKLLDEATEHLSKYLKRSNNATTVN